jgi:cold shock CspA family protein
MTFHAILDHIRTIEAVGASTPAPRRTKHSKPAGVHLGVVVYIHQSGGFGFLKPDAGDEIYIGRRALKQAGDLKPGCRVCFNTKPANKPGTIEAIDVVAEAA